MAAPLPVRFDPAAHRVRDALVDYVVNGVRRADVVRGVVLDSWERCRRNGLDPTKGGTPADADAFADQAERQSDLAESADPAMRHLAQLLEGCESMALLCSPDGTILTILGDRVTIEQGRRSRIVVGANWHELASGTNAVGTALMLGRPVQIHASEHFCEWAQPWSCAAAPVRDPIDRRIVGVVDVTALSHRFGKQSAALAQVAATLAEQQLAMIEQQRRARLLEHYIERADRLPRDGLVLLDRHARVVRANARARALLARRAPGFSLGGEQRLVELRGAPTLRAGLQAAAPWLDPDWLEAIGPEGAPLGMLIVLPGDGASRPAAAEVAVDAGLTPLQGAERAAIVAALRRTRGNLSRVARDLGISRTTLYKRMEAYGLDRDGAGWL